MSKITAGRNGNPFKPSSRTLALEPRILFDGAAAVATEQHTTDTSAHDGQNSQDNSHVPATAVETARSAPPATSAARALLVIDSRLENSEQLTQQLPSGVKAIIVDTQQDGIAAIEKALETMGQVDSVQILSHGAAGQFTLGSTTVSSDNIDQLGSRFAQWSNNLSAGADIQLYGCKIGAGEAGKTLVGELARWTGADVAASNDDTGSKAAGGNWELEVRDGDIDKSIALSAAAIDSFSGLLPDAAPTLSVSGTGADVQLGSNFTFTLNFSNTSSDAGYAPFVDVFLPTTGIDGAGTEIDDGISFVSASYLGQSLVAHVITFDANGQAVHPLAVGTDGQPLVVNAATYGMRAGDQMVVLELPFASVSQGQPNIGIQVTATLSDLADTDFSSSAATPDLTIRARSGFQYGNDALNNPAVDPSLVESGSISYVVHPTVITFDQEIIAPEGETATGPNYGRELQITVSPATSQTITDLEITQPVPDNVIITEITPGANGTLTSITLHNGDTITNPALINAVFARNNDADQTNDVYIQSFTVSYSDFSAPVTTNVDFFVPDIDAEGDSVLNPVTGDDATITFGPPTASGQWQPVDPRDVANPGDTIAFSGDGVATSIVAKSITLEKQVSLQTDIGSAGLSPGDTLNYVININVSDYFAFGKTLLNEGSFVISDTLSDGQTLVGGTLTLSANIDGINYQIPVTFTQVVNPDGTTSLVFDIAASVESYYPDHQWMNGDLSFDDILQGASTAVLSYQAVIGQSYTPPAGTPHSEINEGDSFGNNATVTATIMEDEVNLTGFDQSDSSSTTSTIPTSTVDIDIADLNGNGAPPPGTELRPGDEVTFSLTYDLVTGDYENFSITAYLPLPLFDLTGLDADTLWQLGTDNTNPNSPSSVTIGPGNSLIFTFDDYVNSETDGSTIQIDFTLTVSDQPFADQRSFNVLAESSQTTTLDKNEILSSDDVTLIASVAEPDLSITHGVVSSSNGTVTGTTGSWNAPGTGGAPFTGSVTDINAIEGNVNDIDASDTIRLATAIENSGGGNAYDVSTQITLPPGLSFVGGSLSSANLLIFRGDGTQLIAGVDFTVDNATNTITFVDGAGVGALLAGRPGTDADNSGANLIVITYDTLVAGNINASATLESTGTLLNYASVEGGANFLDSGVLSDTASQQVAAPEISKGFAGGGLDNSDSSASHTTGADLVVGESMLYDIIVTLPEGVTQSLNINDLIPPGMRLDTSFNGSGYQLITTAGGYLALNFGGTVDISQLTTTGTDGGDANFVFSISSASGDNNTDNNKFVIRVRLIATDVSGNQANTVLQNDATLTYTDTDGDTPNSTDPADNIDRNVALTGDKPTITVREPTLQISQTIDTPTDFGFDQDDPVDFTITISNGNSATDFDAFDINFSDTLPTELDGLTLNSVIYTVNGVSTDITSSFSLDPVTRTLVNTGNVDIAKGGSITISLSGVVNATGAAVPNFDNQAQVQWTSIDGTNSDERTGVDGLLNSGVLNDYRLDSALVFPVAQGIRISRVGGLDDTTAPNPTNASVENVAVGELVRYRAAALIPEGENPDYKISITLDAGLTLADLTSMRVAFVSNGGLVTDLSDLITSGVLAIDGDENSPEALYITPDLSGAGPTGVLNSNYVTITTDASGRQVITINFGNVTNGAGGAGDDGNDDNLEGIIVEFTARVNNQVSNQAGDQLGVFVQDSVDGNLRATSDTLFERIVEGGFSGLDKTVSNFDPNVGGSNGTATVTIGFNQSGELPAYDVNLSDSFATGSNYQLVSITIGGTTYAAADLPADGISFSTAGGLSVDFSQIDVGSQISVVYTVDVPNDAIVASSDASLTWSSLPETFTEWGGSTVGADGGVDGERTSADGVGPDNDSVLNNYQLVEAAGLGIISGTLWNDTSSADGSTTPDGLAIAGEDVTLTWAGNDGVFGNADDAVFTATTDANGQFIFGVLPSGLYRIDAPTEVNSVVAFGDMRIRIDTDGATLGQVNITLGEADSQVADSGYVELNDAPVNSLPGTQNAQEDIALAISGVSVSDVDAERDPDTNDQAIQVTLSVTQGTLFFTGATTGVTVTGSNSNSMVLVGRIADINAALASLNYLGNANYNGEDTLTVLTSDLGNFGDFDGNGIPGELTDARTDQDSLLIVVAAVNDAPTAVDDAATAVEAGGRDNQTPGINPAGNLTDNDTDVDLITNPDTENLDLISVTSSIETVAVPALGTVEIRGQYGSLFVDISGAYEYVVDNDNPVVQALRLSGQTLSETFSYEISDRGIPLATANSTAVLTVTIQGANDTPVAVDDTATAIEQGGVDNTDIGNPGDNPPPGFPVAGADATGNVLDNDSDVDSVSNGETKSVTAIRSVPETDVGTPEVVPPGGSISIDGTYGTLTIFSDGEYSYVIDQDNIAVQRLGPNDTLTDQFSYQVTDALGLNDLADLTIIVQGNYDNPVASDDHAQAQASETDDDGNEANPTGNVITFPSRPDDTGTSGGNGIDQDVDGADRPNTNLTVTGIRNGTELAGGALSPVTAGTTLSTSFAQGSTNPSGSSYGELTINPDGSFSFNVNSDHPEIVALTVDQTLDVVVTYQITDTAGLTDTAQLVITVTGANNVPLAGNGVALATEAGGVNNTTAGVNPTGNISAEDPDGDPLTVTAIRTGPESSTGTSGTVGQALQGLYGWLTMNSDGSYSYEVDNDLAAVQALRQASDTLIERFTYTVADPGGLSDSAEIIVVIRGQNDNPVAANDTATAIEAGGVNNATGGTDPIGNVLTNDTDVDSVSNGETKAVDSVRTGATEGAGTAGSLDVELRGTYGWLTLGEDGEYRYRLDNSMAVVQALRVGNTLTESFNYTVIDTAGATDAAVLTITIQGRNDTPVANDDTAAAVEAGGLNNSTPGVNPSGNVLSNDTDVDLNGEVLTVSAVTGGDIGSAFSGMYGSLTLNSDGSFTYTVDNNNPLVQALRTNANKLSESFTYTIRDLAGATSSALLTITISGRNDNPVAINDTNTATEAGGVNNGTPGNNPNGNLLNNDTDVDSGDSKTIDGIRTGLEVVGGSFTSVGAIQSIVGQYGTLTVLANGDYNYVVNNNLAAVQALKPGDTLREAFSYRMHDTAGAQDIAQLLITIEGAWDTPVAANDVGIAVADNGDGLFFDPSGNVLTNDTDVDAGDSLTVTAIRTGQESGSGTAGTVGSVLVGQYGSLVLNADGSYDYILDKTNPDVLALDLLDTLFDYFTYTATDNGGLSDPAQLSILIIGRNDPPVGVDDSATAIEAGGINNNTPGVNPSGNVLSNDTDLENGVLTVTGIRTGTESGTGTNGTVGTSLRGLYGNLTLNSNGTWNYVLDNSLAAVQALRISGQTLTETFTYTVEDPYLADDTAQLVITIDGRNDTPVAVDDNATAVEAGGIFNGTPGVNPQGNVLDNDTDVDSVANGETKQVLSASSETGNTSSAGQVLVGRYGSLTLNADGSYQYVLDNNNPTVQALRTAGETLRETFTYRMRDAAGAESSARLNLLIQGANDNPLAVNDSNVASDQLPAPQTSGNVLPNDSDVDGGDSLQVVAIRTGAEDATGTTGAIGQPLVGRYGTLVLNADGSYTYSIDLTNNEVLAAAGLGQVLSDVFTYTLGDLAGATDPAELVITLDITAPFIPPSKDGPFHHESDRDPADQYQPLLKDIDPAVFISPVVERDSKIHAFMARESDGSKLLLGSAHGLLDDIVEINPVAGQFVHQQVLESQFDSELDMAWILSRQERVDLTADGLLSNPSLFGTTPDNLTLPWQAPEQQPASNQTANSFQNQLKNAALQRSLLRPEG
ncbi:VCBS domain-containing protein [Pseudomonas sp. M30-35]|uniref:VCBS domain-containing protein n=1 Tax=Pseudomonas sp. M30-35 TaxID=1981174 RepID=UPI000B3C2423|nr:VCBS domain-containing protein [Pseudomonas sp. M30-35]ARU88113.1 adhesin [Pseudomonas sp. M30-35]